MSIQNEQSPGEVSLVFNRLINTTNQYSNRFEEFRYLKSELETMVAERPGWSQMALLEDICARL